MGWFERLFSGNLPDEESDETYDEETYDEEKKEFDIIGAIRGMTEKQLLRLLVISDYETREKDVTDSWRELIQISKEEE